MSRNEKKWVIALASLGLAVGGCSGNSQLVGSNGGSGGAAGSESSSDLSYTVMPLNIGPNQCLPEPLAAEARCQVLTTRTGAACGCSGPGLLPSAAGVTAAVQWELKRQGQCGAAGQPSCAKYCACELTRALGPDLIECKTAPEPSPDSTGWCYVAAAAGEPQTELVADCPSSQQQKLRFIGDQSLLENAINLLACLESAAPARPLEVGEVCFNDQEQDPSDSPGYSVEEVNLISESPMCDSGICLVNHFQGLVSCPYGQAAGAADCRVPGGNQAVKNKVKPQLVDRQAAVASICSCHCDGDGPGPYCTCPEWMQCEPMFMDLGFGRADLAGSYCIPKGTEYDRDAPRIECVEPNCGVKHPY